LPRDGTIKDNNKRETNELGSKITIERKKQIKAGSRLKKIKLVEIMNKDWKDLSDEI